MALRESTDTVTRFAGTYANACPLLSDEYSSDIQTGRGPSADKVLAVTDQPVTVSTQSSPPMIYHLSKGSSLLCEFQGPDRQGDGRVSR